MIHIPLMKAVTPAANIVEDGLITHLDASDISSNPGSGSLWYDLSPSGVDFNVGSAATHTTVGGVPVIYVNNIASSSMSKGHAQFYRMYNFTWEVWYRTNGAYVANGNLMHDGYNNNTRWRFSSSGVPWVYDADGTILGGSAFPTNTWVQATVTRSGNSSVSTKKLYKNAVQHDTKTDNYSPSYGSGVILLGTYNSSSERGRFYYNIVRIYNRALTVEEIQQNYDSTISRFS